ncbi:MAG TPA: VOC family protein [Burkholderiales bacterium]|nr:VOC family protein [Burkholderiales bacterium]
MKPRVTLITLGVDDLERAVAFYRALGLKTDGIVGAEHEHGAVAFFDLQPGLKLALWPRASIAHHTRLPATPVSPTEFMLAHNVNSKAEVDSVMDDARKAGAKIVDPAHDTFWGGYSGVFQDPDRHLWEVAWNPEWKVEK